MSDYLIRLSKTMARALRHAPEDYGLTLEEGGWTEVEALAAGIRGSGSRWWRELTTEEIRQVVAMTSDKPRYELQGEKIRALHGHSSPVQLDYQASTPPEKLYHGTSKRSLDSIREGGLRPMRRQYVHLSPDAELAAQVGARQRGQTIILTILAAEAAAAGYEFYQTSDSVWLTRALSPEFITFP